MAKNNKTIKLSVDIGANDRIRKAKQAINFLEKKIPVRVELRLKGWRQRDRTGDAMLVVNTFIADIGHPENKVNPLKWNNTTLQTYLHP
jgi:translation initiation factor IF-3